MKSIPAVMSATRAVAGAAVALSIGAIIASGLNDALIYALLPPFVSLGLSVTAITSASLRLSAASAVVAAACLGLVDARWGYPLTADEAVQRLVERYPDDPKRVECRKIPGGGLFRQRYECRWQGLAPIEVDVDDSRIVEVYP